jgi:hypothetical protein
LTDITAVRRIGWLRLWSSRSADALPKVVINNLYWHTALEKQLRGQLQAADRG